jgi:microcystin-dependent protein
MIDYSGAGDADARWLLADGRALARAGQYAPLFAIQGTTYGAGDGSTTFNLPDCRGRVSVGPDHMGTAAGAAGRLPNSPNGRGNVGGEERHAISTAELPSHSHGVGSLSIGVAGSHQHAGPPSHPWFATCDGAIITGSGLTGAGTNVPCGPGRLFTHNMTGFSGDHAHGISGSVAATGSGTPASVMQPYVVLNKLIRVL